VIAAKSHQRSRNIIIDHINKCHNHHPQGLELMRERIDSFMTDKEKLEKDKEELQQILVNLEEKNHKEKEDLENRLKALEEQNNRLEEKVTGASKSFIAFERKMEIKEMGEALSRIFGGIADTFEEISQEFPVQRHNRMYRESEEFGCTTAEVAIEMAEEFSPCRIS
jgi:predicted nuclease with TOPRIM domain